MVGLAEDYADSIAETFYDDSVSDRYESERECENGCTDENHFDVFYEGYLQGIREEKTVSSVSVPNVVIGLRCSSTDDVQSYVQIRDKVALTIPEAAAYSNIGQNRIEKLLKMPNCPFALFVGAKKLVKRSEFDKFISQTLEL